MNLMLVSLIEIVYLFYMFYYFKTDIDFNRVSPVSYFFNMFFNLIEEQKTNFTDSIIENRKIYLNHYDGKSVKVCLFGRYMILLLFLFFIARHFIMIPKHITKIILTITLLLSMININALVYLLPVLFIEVYFLTR